MHFLQKLFFYNQNLNLWGKHLQKMAGCNRYMTIIHAPLNLSFVMYRADCLSLTAYTNERNTNVLLFKSLGACFRYILICSANVFLSHSGILANAKTI